MADNHFRQQVMPRYQVSGASLYLGGALHPSLSPPYPPVQLALKNFNRHGLIAGATGTGKTKTLQGLAESLSDQGVAVMLMDIKGDLSGLAAPGAEHPKIDERHQRLGRPFSPAAFPVEFFSLSQAKGVRLRATVSEFGPMLLAKMLGLNDTQQGVLAVLFQYSDQQQLPLVDLQDLKSLFLFAQQAGKAALEKNFGRISPASLGAMLRKVSAIERQGADIFFGEPSLDIYDLLRQRSTGQGIISTVRLSDMQDRPKLYSTFMLGLLAELHATLPEVGDLDKPKLVLFIDEAHLLFKQATAALLDQIEYTVKLIRSKGVGLVFCTQRPTDIPEAVLSQLGFKIQHALRAFTAKDRRNIRTSAENFPLSPYYSVAELITQLGVGEAMVSALDEQGVPTPTVHTLLQAPRSRMGVLRPEETQAVIQQSALVARYQTSLDRLSAHELLQQRMTQLIGEPENQADSAGTQPAHEAPAWWESMSKNTLVRQMGRTIAREIARSLLGALGTRRR